MASTKSPSARFGSFFGIKRRPSSNLVIRPSSPSYEQQQDPFSTNGPVVTTFSVTTAEPSTATSVKGPLGREPALVIDIPKFRAPSRRPGSPSPPSFRRQIGVDDHEHQLRVEVSDEDEAEDAPFPVSDTTGSRSLGRPPPLTMRNGSATSVESLALAAAIAHANGMVLSPDPASANSHRGKSPAIDEYPSPPPSNHGSPQSSRRFLEDEEESVFHTVGSVGSTGPSSLPTTPSILDSFPTIPFSSLHIGTGESHHSSPFPAIAPDALPVRSSSRPSRHRAGSTPDAWSTPVTQRYHSDQDQVWEVAEQDEADYDYSFSSGVLPLPGPPPSVPLPPEPVSPRFQTSIIHKHFHQLELDITSLTRKLTSTASTPGGSTYPSTPESSKAVKKSASHSILRREHSGMSASSGASSSQGVLSSISTSTVAVPLSSSPQISESNTSPYLTGHNSAQVGPTFSPCTSNRQRSTTDPLIIAPLKLKDKEKKSHRERDGSKSRDEKEKDRESHPKRRFFSKYASSGSQVEKEAAALLASIADQEDVNTMDHEGDRGFADEEWNANLGPSVSSAGKAKDTTSDSSPMSPSSQQSPIDGTSPVLSTSWTAMSPTEKVVQHILPPAELLRLEKMGFATGDGISSRGRDVKLGSPLSSSPVTTSPLKTSLDWNRRSISTSRVDTGPPVFPVVQTRPQRSGSLAAPSPISPSSNPRNAMRHYLHGEVRASKSSNALPQASESRMNAEPRGVTESRGNGAFPSSSRPPSSEATSPAAMKLGMMRPATTPSSPANGFAPLSLPPPPRPRVRSLRLHSGEGQTNGNAAASSRSHRSSTASSQMSTSTAMPKRHSIMKKPSFIDMGDEDGRPSLEEASPATAPGINIDDDRSYSQYGSRTPSVRSRSGTIDGWQPPDVVSTASRSRSGTINAWQPSDVASTGSRSSSGTINNGWQPAEISNSSSIVRGASYVGRTDDSFLDMGKLSLDTIRSVDEDDGNPQTTTPGLQAPAVSQYRQAQKPSSGSPYGSAFYKHTI